jgi:uncharacterized Rossmann fold enzyme
MLQKFKAASRVLRYQGFKSFYKKLVLELEYRRDFEKVLTDEDYKQWELLKDIYKGKRAFLIGNGPSLNKTPLYLLKGEKAMCFNRFSLMEERLGWSPSFFSIVDNLLLKDLGKELPSLVEKTEYSFFPAIHFRGLNVRKILGGHKKTLFMRHIKRTGFSQSLPDVYPGGTVIFEGFQILKHLGFNEIYFMGVDMNYQIHKTAKPMDFHKSNNITSQEDDDPNHFDPRYFGKGMSYHQPEKYVIDNIMRNLEFLRKITDRIGLKIVNVGLDSKVDCFPRDTIENVLGIDETKADQIFCNLIRKKTGYSSVQDLHRVAKKITEAEEVESVYRCDLEEVQAIVKKMVVNYLPLGPYKNSYYFIKRSHND